jgi:hypothetical protein
MSMIWQKAMNAPASTGIQFVGGRTATRAASTSGTVTLAINSGLTGGIASAAASGDFVIGIFATASTADRTLSITDGTTDYTLIGSELYANDTYDTNLRVGYKRITADTAITFGATGNANDQGVIGACVFRGVNATTPIDVTTTTATGTDGSAANPPSITPVTPGAFIVCVGASAYDFASGQAFSSSLTDFFSVRNDAAGNIIVMGFGHKDDWSSGAFDAAAFTPVDTSSLNSWAAMSIALRPA